MYSLTIFDDIKVCLNGSPGKKSAILDLPYFRKMPKGPKMAFIGLTIWRAITGYSIKKIHVYATFRFHPVAPGLLHFFKKIILTLDR